MDCDQKELLKKIQEMEFVTIELQLYLDTHPGDQEALNDYRCAVQVLRRHLKEYEENFGSLAEDGYHDPCGRWNWIDGPWPWQM